MNKKDLQRASKLFGMMTFLQTGTIFNESIAENLTLEDMDKDILPVMITCMQVLRGFGLANPYLKAEILSGLEIIQRDLIDD